MTMSRLIQRSLPLVAGAIAGIAPIASAQWYPQSSRSGQQLFEWRGGVDREVQIFMRGNRVWTNNVGWTEPNNERARTITALPRQDGQVVVRREDGRGSVDVIQQPNAQNGYTTVVRVQDPRSGSDTYRLTAYWQGYSNGDVYGGDVYRGGRADNNGRRRADERSHGRRGEEMGHRNRDRDDDDDDDRNGGWNSDRNGGYRRESLLHWSGNVDNELEIRLQNGRVEYRTLSGAQPTSIRVNAGNTNIPRSSAQLRVAQNSGRGSVWITQQPSQWNGYTTVIRVRDPQGGYGYYDFDLMWQ